MTNKREATSKRAVREGGGVLPALCNIAGAVLIAAVILLCAPLAVPQLLGYGVYEVQTGSMEPSIPTGAAVYVKATDPDSVQVDDVIAFREGDGMVVHRVVTNRKALGEYVTKGDANNVEDLSPVPYEALVGRVEFVVPGLGAFMEIYATATGKVYIALVAACGVMLEMLASRMRARRRALAEARAGAGAGAGADSSAAAGAGASAGATAAADAAAGTERASGARSAVPPRRRRLRVAIAVVLGVVFVGSGGVIAFTQAQYAASDACYSEASARFTAPAEGEGAPISVDFAALRAENPDIIGWLYCEGTVIDYPVLQGPDNDAYLHRDYTGAYNLNGSIFADSVNASDFSDCNTIVYGHHMNSGSMFAGLESWADQVFYEEHPVMWLLTPGQDYKVVLFSGHHESAHSGWYDAIVEPGPRMDAFLSDALSSSDFQADVRPSSDAHCVMFSTCAYVFDDARYILHGVLSKV